jgi:hypothetical protein
LKIILVILEIQSKIEVERQKCKEEIRIKAIELKLDGK